MPGVMHGTKGSMVSGRVLSIQSHVVHGYVGNRIATLAMQLLGVEVDEIHTVLLSNHTGYPTMKGTIKGSDDFNELCEGLEANSLIEYDFVLSGYAGSEDVLLRLTDFVDKLKVLSPTTKYICDPVLGDDGEYYTSPKLLNVFRSSLLPRAYLITPNQFEAEQILGRRINCDVDAVQAMLELSRFGPKLVALTSAAFSSRSDALELHCYILEIFKDQGVAVVCKYIIPKLPGTFVGTGDLTAALLTSWLLEIKNSDAALTEIELRNIVSSAIYADAVSPDSWNRVEISVDSENKILRAASAFGLALSSVQSVLKQTNDKAAFRKCQEISPTNREAFENDIRELNIVGARHSIMAPSEELLSQANILYLKI